MTGDSSWAVRVHSDREPSTACLTASHWCHCFTANVIHTLQCIFESQYMAGPGTGLAVALPSTPTSTVEVVSAVVVRLMIAAANFNYELESTTHWHGGGGGDIWRGDFEWVLSGPAGRVGRIPGRGSRQPEHRDSDNLECGPGRNSVVTVTTHTRNGACQSTAVGWMENWSRLGPTTHK